MEKRNFVLVSFLHNCVLLYFVPKHNHAKCCGVRDVESVESKYTHTVSILVLLQCVFAPRI